MCYSVFDDYGANANEVSMNGGCVYVTEYADLAMEEKLQVDLHPAALHDEYIPNLKMLQEKVLKR